MKVAIESNDGVTIKSPFIRTRGYVVYDINETNIVGCEYRESKAQNVKAKDGKVVTSDKFHSLLNDCSTIISRGMERSNLDVFKKEGIDVFITFKTSAKDAVRLYMRELLISNKFAH